MLPKKVVSMSVNGDPVKIVCAPYLSLLDVLRDHLGLTGVKEGCGTGNCGACSVIFDGELVNACLVLAVEADGKSVITIEGLATGTGLHPIQQAFLKNDALQCGFCTPGFIMSAKALLDWNPDPAERGTRNWLGGNLCRCTGYDKIVRAVLAASDEIMTRPDGG